MSSDSGLCRLRSGKPGDLTKFPQDIAGYLCHAGESDGEAFTDEEFFKRVSEREGVTGEAAFEHAKSVKSVIQSVNEMVGSGELEDVREQLPQGLASLFG